MLTVTTPAADRTLAPIAALRAAVGVTDGSRDADLIAMEKRISAEIAEACGIAAGQCSEPTLRRERLTETFGPQFGPLILSRRHNVEIVSVSEAGTLLTLDAGAVDPETGILERLIDGRSRWWSTASTTITYNAGFATVPESLIGVVCDLVRQRLAEGVLDPTEKSRTIEVPGVESIRVDRFAPAGGSLPDGIMARLARFRNVSVFA